MIITCQAKPIFCDIRMDDYNIDEEKIEALITTKTKAICVVHFS
jgi:dTDP-4-amino-4,6-dideoxygalactose transaminase